MTTRTATTRLHRSATVAMDTMVIVQVVAAASDREIQAAMDRALTWFRTVEQACSRFEPESEVMRIAAQPGRPVPASPLLLEATAFALELAQLTAGAFDPAIGGRLEAMGFDSSYRTGQRMRSAAGEGSYHDVLLDRRAGTITLKRPLVLDLGAVAKGFAIDLAALELRAYPGFSIDAGGDLLVRGRNAAGAPWRVGIRDPRQPDMLLTSVHLTEGAVCTSGDYERGAHILDARTGAPPDSMASASVIAPTAMAADGLSTAAMLLGPTRGLALLERQGVQGLLVLPDSRSYTTHTGFGS